MVTVAGHGCTVVVATLANLIGILGEPVLGNETAVVGHEKAAIFVEAARRAGELKRTRIQALFGGDTSNVRKYARFEAGRFTVGYDQ